MAKFLYIVDHFIGFPRSEYGGIWNVIAESDEQCFDIIVSEDDELNLGYYSKLRENIKNSSKYQLLQDDIHTKVVSSFIT